MARTKQTARKASGGKAPRRQVQSQYKEKAYRKYNNYDRNDRNSESEESDYDSDLEENQTSSSKSDSISSENAILEDFALADDRAAVVAELVPGSAPFYYFSIIQELNRLGETKDLSEFVIVEEWLDSLQEFPEYSSKVTALQHRLHLLKLDRSKDLLSDSDQSEQAEQIIDESLNYLTDTLDIQHPIQSGTVSITREVGSQRNKTNIFQPSKLTFEQVILDHFTSKGLFDRKSKKEYCSFLSSINPESYEQLLQVLLDNSSLTSLTRVHRIGLIRSLLAKPILGDTPGLLKCVIADLKNDWNSLFPSDNSDDEFEPTSFASREAHAGLFREQLEELYQVVPAVVANNVAYYQYYLNTFHATNEQIQQQIQAWNLQKNYAGYWKQLEKGVFLQFAWDLLERFAESVRNGTFSETPREELVNYRHIIMYNKLSLDLEFGVWDYSKFLIYLSSYNAKHQESVYCHVFSNPFKLNFNLSPQAIRGLKKKYLAHFLAHPPIQSTEQTPTGDSEDPNELLKPYREFFSKQYLNRTLAKVKLMSGSANPEKWCGFLGSSSDVFAKLSELQQLFFAPGNREYFHPSDQVELKVTVKNIASLIVQVYQLNSFMYYKTYNREITQDITLDGLVANHYQEQSFAVPPIQQVHRTISIPSISSTPLGLFIVEMVGGGKACRAIIRKGHISFLQTLSLEGHEFQCFDDDNNDITRDCSIFLDSEYYYPDSTTGKILVPFYENQSSSLDESPTDQNVSCVITFRKNEYSCSRLVEFVRKERAFVLSAGMYVDSEQLIPGQKATLVVRPKLFLYSRVCPLDCLKNITLALSYRNSSGENVSKEIFNLSFKENSEFLYEFDVDQNANSIDFSISADVVIPSQTRSKDQKITAREARFTEVKDSFTIALGYPTSQENKIFTPHLRNSSSGYEILILGRSGESAQAGISYDIRFVHQALNSVISFSATTDAQGKIFLGKLENISRVTLDDISWFIRPYFHQISANRVLFSNSRLNFSPHGTSSSAVVKIHTVENELVQIPYTTGKSLETHQISSEFSLILKSSNGSNQPIKSVVDVIRYNPEGFLEMRFPACGTYHLRFKSCFKQGIIIKVLRGQIFNDLIFEPESIETFTNRKFLQISNISIENQQLHIRLKNTGTFGRVHILARNFLPSSCSIGPSMAKPPAAEEFSVPKNILGSVYLTSRQISEEYQYILKRRTVATHRPGNFLERPSLILNGYVQQQTSAESFSTRSGHNYSIQDREQIRKQDDQQLTSLDASYRFVPGSSSFSPFVAESSRSFWNLVPQLLEDGFAHIYLPYSELGNATQIFVCAVNSEDTVEVQFSPESREKLIPIRDTSLAQSKGFSPNIRLAEHFGTSVLRKDERLVLHQSETLQVAVYDSVAKLFCLLDSLSNYSVLFNEFIKDWISLDTKTKITHYTENVSHELNLFLYFKDPDFFLDVVRPYLKNKKEKQFLDKWMLDEDLSSYLHLYAFLRLNVAERILLAVRIPERANEIRQHILDLAHNRPEDDASKFKSFTQALNSTNSSKSFSIEYRSGEHLRSEQNKRARPSFDARSNFVQQAYYLNDDMEEEDDYNDDDDYDYANDRYEGKKRQKTSSTASGITNTQQLAEKHYHDGSIEKQSKRGDISLLRANAFYQDLIEWICSHPTTPREDSKDFDRFQGFLSNNITQVNMSFAELMFVLSVTDLPFHPRSPSYEQISLDSNQVGITANDRMIIYHKDIRQIEVHPFQTQTKVVVTQTLQEAESSVSIATNELLSGKIYESTITVLNTSSESISLVQILFQIPTGSIPIGKQRFNTASKLLNLSAHESESVSYRFYFKDPGEFQQYPAHVSQAGKVFLCASDVPSKLLVVKQRQTIDQTSWEDVSIRGSVSDLVNFLQKPDTDLSLVNFGLLSNRLGEKSLYDQVISTLRRRFFYSKFVWGFSLVHRDFLGLGELLAQEEQFISQCGVPLEFSFVRLSEEHSEFLEQITHLEFAPLVHARTHSLNNQYQKFVGLNKTLEAHYERTLLRFAFSKSLSNNELLVAVYFLILQDRIEDAHRILTSRLGDLSVCPENIQTKLQYDYLRAYLDLSLGSAQDFTLAQQIAESYRSYPIPSWRIKFEKLLQVLDQYRNSKCVSADLSLNGIPSLEIVKVNEADIEFQFTNIGGIRVQFYEIDVEASFSFEPFAEISSSRCSVIQPSYQTSLTFDKKNETQSQKFNVLENYQQKQFIVEISTLDGSIRAAGNHFCSQIQARIDADQGTLLAFHVNSTQRLAGVYVKVFAKISGQSVFYKDGYTDLLGCFDYASDNENRYLNASAFSILLHSPEFGSTIQQVHSAPLPRSTAADSRLVRAQS